MTRWGSSRQVDRATVNSEFKEYQKLISNSDFKKNLNLHNKFAHRNSNVFSIFLSNLDWDKGAKNNVAVFDLANGFFPFIDNEIKTFLPDLEENFRRQIESRKNKSGVYFQFAMNCPAYPQMGFNLWYLVGDMFPMSIDDMVLEARLLLALWKRYTDKAGFLGLASTVFDDVIIGEMESPEFGRYQGGQAFERSAKESSLVISDNQEELKKLDSSLLLCDSRTSYLLFNSFVGREFESKDKKHKFRIMTTFDLSVLDDPNK